MMSSDRGVEMHSVICPRRVAASSTATTVAVSEPKCLFAGHGDCRISKGSNCSQHGRTASGSQHQGSVRVAPAQPSTVRPYSAMGRGVLFRSRCSAPIVASVGCRCTAVTSFSRGSAGVVKFAEDRHR